VFQFEGEPLEHVEFTSILIENSGNSDIVADEVLTPITISIPQDVSLYSIQLDPDKASSDNHYELTQTPCGCNISFAFMRPKESIAIAFLHGKTKEDYTVSIGGKIKDGKVFDTKETESKEKAPRFFRQRRFMTIGFLICLVALIVVAIPPSGSYVNKCFEEAPLQTILACYIALIGLAVPAGRDVYSTIMRYRYQINRRKKKAILSAENNE